MQTATVFPFALPRMERTLSEPERRGAAAQIGPSVFVGNVMSHTRMQSVLSPNFAALHSRSTPVSVGRCPRLNLGQVNKKPAVLSSGQTLRVMGGGRRARSKVGYLLRCRCSSRVLGNTGPRLFPTDHAGTIRATTLGAIRASVSKSVAAFPRSRVHACLIVTLSASAASHADISLFDLNKYVPPIAAPMPNPGALELCESYLTRNESPTRATSI